MGLIVLGHHLPPTPPPPLTPVAPVSAALVPVVVTVMQTVSVGWMLTVNAVQLVAPQIPATALVVEAAVPNNLATAPPVLKVRRAVS